MLLIVIHIILTRIIRRVNDRYEEKKSVKEEII